VERYVPSMDRRRGRGAGGGPPRRSLWDLAPSTPLEVEEAAELAGVPVRELERHLESGALLFETGRRNGKDVRLVRVVDLRDVFDAREPEPPPPASRLTGDPADEGDTETERPAAAERPVADRVETARSGPEGHVAERPAADTALAPLLTELRARLDEAERERRASTAGLLLAQRRLLALETSAQPVPWHRRSALWTGAFATVAGLALWVDLSGRLGDVAAAARDGQGALAGTADRLDAEVGGLGRQLTTLVETSERARQEAEAARRVAEARAAEEAATRRAELERMERERETLVTKLDELRRDADAARASLDVERDAGSRERERFAQRLDAAERDLTRAREAVEAERRLATEDRAAFLARLDAVQRAESEREAASREALVGLARELEALRAQTAAAEAAAQAATRAAGEVQGRAEGTVTRPVPEQSPAPEQPTAAPSGGAAGGANPDAPRQAAQRALATEFAALVRRWLGRE